MSLVLLSQESADNCYLCVYRAISPIISAYLSDRQCQGVRIFGFCRRRGIESPIESNPSGTAQYGFATSAGTWIGWGLSLVIKICWCSLQMSSCIHCLDDLGPEVHLISLRIASLSLFCSVKSWPLPHLRFLKKSGFGSLCCRVDLYLRHQRGTMHFQYFIKWSGQCPTQHHC